MQNTNADPCQWQGKEAYCRSYYLLSSKLNLFTKLILKNLLYYINANSPCVTLEPIKIKICECKKLIPILVNAKRKEASRSYYLLTKLKENFMYLDISYPMPILLS